MSKKFRSKYDPSLDVGVVFTGPGMTKQEFREECNVNNILRKYRKTGLLPSMIKSNPQYGDFSDVGSYQEACNIVLFAQEQFSALPASTRDRFGNDPVKFLEFVNDPRNSDELVKMGLATKKEPAMPAPGALEESPVPRTPKSAKQVPRQREQEPADD